MNISIFENTGAQSVREATVKQMISELPDHINFRLSDEVNVWPHNATLTQNQCSPSVFVAGFLNTLPTESPDRNVKLINLPIANLNKKTNLLIIWVDRCNGKKHLKQFIIITGYLSEKCYFY